MSKWEYMNAAIGEFLVIFGPKVEMLPGEGVEMVVV